MSFDWEREGNPLPGEGAVQSGNMHSEGFAPSICKNKRYMHSEGFAACICKHNRWMYGKVSIPKLLKYPLVGTKHVIYSILLYTILRYAILF